MSKSSLYIIIGILALGAAVAGYLYYEERQGGIDIEIDKDGVTIDGK